MTPLAWPAGVGRRKPGSITIDAWGPAQQELPAAKGALQKGLLRDGRAATPADPGRAATPLEDTGRQGRDGAGTGQGQGGGREEQAQE